MFSGLRQGSVIYVLSKQNQPSLRIGQVQGVSSPRPRYNQYQPQQPFAMQEQVIDISVKYPDGSVENYNQLPSSLCIANFGDKGIVLAESRDAMVAEVEGMKRNSQNIIDSVDYHKGVVTAADEILASINPASAERKANDERFGKIEDRMGNVEGTLGQVVNMLQTVLDRSESDVSPKKK